jgi:hypothetical protein
MQVASADLTVAAEGDPQQAEESRDLAQRVEKS